MFPFINWKRILAIYIRRPKICVSFEAFSQLPFTLMAVENDFSTMDESQSGNNHEWDHYTIFYWADKIIKFK